MGFYDFNEMLMFSQGSKLDSDIDTIKKILLGTTYVEKSSTDLDKMGVDFIATLRGGAQVFIDVKTRQDGCSKYWNGEPEVAIEKWSAIPNKLSKGKVGWTLDEKKLCDMIMYTFPKNDCNKVFLLGFQTLRIATRLNIESWYGKYKVGVQNSGNWKSEAVFVPISVVFKAMKSAQSFER